MIFPHYPFVKYPIDVKRSNQLGAPKKTTTGGFPLVVPVVILCVYVCHPNKVGLPVIRTCSQFLSYSAFEHIKLRPDWMSMAMTACLHHRLLLDPEKKPTKTVRRLQRSSWLGQLRLSLSQLMVHLHLQKWEHLHLAKSSDSGQMGPPPSTCLRRSVIFWSKGTSTCHGSTATWSHWSYAATRSWKWSIFVCSPPLTWGNGIQLDEHMWPLEVLLVVALLK